MQLIGLYMSKKPKELLNYVQRDVPRSLIKTRVRTLRIGQSVSSPASPEQSPKHASSKSSTFLTSSRTIEAAFPHPRPSPAFTLLPSPHTSAAKPPSRLPPKPSTRATSALSSSAPSAVTRCGFKSRTGSVLSRSKKHNQDTYVVAPLLGQSRGQYLFAVCDGHGTNGHLVARLLKEVLPKCVAEAMPQSGEWAERLRTGLVGGIAKAEECLGRAGIDISRSGSTCVAVAISGKTLACANVGDSRAILVREQRGKWTYEPLSIDHKPSLTREYQRITACGGRISPYRQPNGDPIGPDRVWLSPDSGLAMSRSLGDSLAHTVGITSDPEILLVELSSSDRAVVVGSDGLWEFVNSQEVAEIVGTFWTESDLEGTCDQLVRVALTRWRREDVVDDITVLVVYLHV